MDGDGRRSGRIEPMASRERFSFTLPTDRPAGTEQVANKLGLVIEAAQESKSAST
ncbi:hypothetical protein [Rhizobium sp. A37_96]